MIRHAAPSSTVAAISFDVHGTATRSCLIASPSFPLPVAASFLRTGSDAVDLAAIAPSTDKKLRAAVRAQKDPARRLIQIRWTAFVSYRGPTLDQGLQDLVLQRSLRALALGPILLTPRSSLNAPVCCARPAWGYVDNAKRRCPHARRFSNSNRHRFDDWGQQESPALLAPPDDSRSARPRHRHLAASPSLRAFRQPSTSHGPALKPQPDRHEVAVQRV